MPKRVLIAGLFHETHTFLDGTTGLDAFALRRGDELFDARGDGSPLAGLLEVADRANWTLFPTIDMRATPSATVDDAVLDFFWNEFLRRAEEPLRAGIDGIYLVLHGAMATTSCRDVEGEIVTRLRALPGAGDVPICGVLDLHGNVSERSITPTQGFDAYRCNPHTDAHAAAVAGAELLERIL
jgi:microcystin degradation protein MlrC